MSGSEELFLQKAPSYEYFRKTTLNLWPQPCRNVQEGYQLIFLINLWTPSKTYFRSSYPEVFCEKGALRNFVKFTGKHPCKSLFFNKVAGLRPVTLFKKGSCTGVFLWILRNFWEHLFLQDTFDGCYWYLRDVNHSLEKSYLTEWLSLSALTLIL